MTQNNTTATIGTFLKSRYKNPLNGKLDGLAVDEDGSILDCKYMKGVSVLARFKGLDGLVGKNIFDESIEMSLDEPLKKAYKVALSRFAHIKEERGRLGEEA